MKFPRRILDEITAEAALEHVILDPYYQKHSHNKKIVGVNLQSEKGCDATLHITVEKQMEDIVL